MAAGLRIAKRAVAPGRRREAGTDLAGLAWQDIKALAFSMRTVLQILAVALAVAVATFYGPPPTDAADDPAAPPQSTTKRKSAPAKKTTAAKKKGDPAASRNGKGTRSAPGNQPGTAPPAPSFTADVAPILMARCGNCHIRNTRGGLSMASYAALAQGSSNGAIISPGASQASRLVEAIFSGDMPRGGGQVGPDELQVIALWIDAGARFDGADPTAPLGQQAPMRASANAAQRNAAESVRFVRDLAPALVTNCISCHGGDQPAGELRLDTFAGLVAGGKSGKVIEPEKPQESLLLKRLRGIDGARMPKGKPAVSSETIARFENWIKAGARFDGADATLPLPVAVERLANERLPHDELTAKRIDQAGKIWALAAGEEQVEPLQTANFLLLGNVSSDRLATVGKLAEAERTKIVKLLKLDGDAPLVKGRLIVFVLDRAADYAEFIRAVEEREVPPGVSGHALAKGIDLYAVLVAASGSDDVLPALVAEQIAGGFLLSFGNVPPWFAVGAARTIAARVEPKSPLVKKWDADLQRSATCAAPDAFMTVTVFDDETAAQSYAFVRAMTQKLPLLQTLVAALSPEQDFDQLLTQIFRHDAQELLRLWLRRK